MQHLIGELSGFNRSLGCADTYHTPKDEGFFKSFKIQLSYCFITQLVKKLQQLTVYELIVDMDNILFVLNT